uniref:Family with sequence similarity 170 member A n=1 Tax=Loxodonta africana TaxID=9785 RepID=G3UM95_LOXAF
SEDDAPQSQTNVVVPAWSQASAENSFSSEYFSCVSSARKLTLVNEDGTHRLHQDISCFASSEMPVLQDLEKGETSSPFPHVSFPFHSVYKTCVSSVHVTEKERVMKIYYMRVQMKRGVAVLWDTEQELGPLKKKARIEEMSFPEKIHKRVSLSYVSTKELLPDSESSLNWENQEEMEQADSLEEPPDLEDCSRARTPEWLVTLDSGFRCMGCCRVFPSLEVLQEHVEHGVNEGFSCHAFHLALAWL